MGHLNENDFDARYKSWNSVAPGQLFDLPIRTKVSSQMTSVASNIKDESRNAGKLFIWTDCDREGEHIGWEITQVAKSGNNRLSNDDIKRAMFNNVAPDHLRHAALNPVNLDLKKADAVEGRIEIDLRTGAAFTRFQTLALQSRFPQILKEVISYGSCQFPTLGFVVERYNRVQNFIPEPFWYIALAVKHDGIKVDFNWDRNHLFDRMSVTVIYERCVEGANNATIISVDKKPTSKWRPLPLTTVELQKQGARFLKMSSKKIMDVSIISLICTYFLTRLRRVFISKGSSPIPEQKQISLILLLI